MQDRRAFQNAGSKCVIERGQRQSFDERMDDGGESFVRKEDSREDPHWHHDQIDQAADRFDLLGAAGGEQADSAEGERADSPNQRRAGPTQLAPKCSQLALTQ